MFNLPPVQWFSFALGLLLAVFGFFIYILVQQVRGGTGSKTNLSLKNVKSSVGQSSAENYICQVAIQRSQRAHLAEQLFSLDEILVEPLLIAPPFRLEPGATPPPENLTSQLVPYLPDFPELSGTIGVPRLSIAEALSGGYCVSIIGQPGSGKSVALARFASIIARRNSTAKQYSTYLPLYCHILDLDIFNHEPRILLDPFIDIIASQTPLSIHSQINRAIQSGVKDNKVIILLDGMDELPQKMFDYAVSFLGAIKNKYPLIPIVCTTSSEYTGNLSQIGFIPLSIASWTNKQKQDYIENWVQLWNTYIIPMQKDQNVSVFPPGILKNWLLSPVKNFSPFELTLKVWGFLSGDLAGDNLHQLLGTYTQRIFSESLPINQIASIAYDFFRSGSPVRSSKDLEKSLGLNSGGTAQDLAASSSISPANSEDQNSNNSSEYSPGALVSKLIESGILIEAPDELIRFSHPILLGYFASYYSSPTIRFSWMDASHWTSNVLYHRSLAIQDKVFPWLGEWLKAEDPPLFRNLFLISRILPYAPVVAEWRPGFMKMLLNIVQSDGTPLALKLKSLCIFATSNDPSIPALFNQLIQAGSKSIRMTTSLASCILQDSNLIPALTSLSSDKDANLRFSAILALSAIENPGSLKTIVEILLNGDELSRQMAAEALAYKPPEGYEVLKEALQEKDLLTRRAAVFGLMQIREEWVLSILERITIQDGQWVVRNAASQGSEILQKDPYFIPRNPPSPANNPWLVKLAIEQGKGIAPDEIPIPFLIHILLEGTKEQKLEAIEYLTMNPTDTVISTFLTILYDKESDIKESIYSALWRIALSGIPIMESKEVGSGKK